MIGALLAARFVAKKPWGVSAIFWAIVLVTGLVITAIFSPGIIVSFILGLIIFLGVAWYYLKVHPIWLGLIMYVASFIINIIIGMLLGAISGGAWLAW